MLLTTEGTTIMRRITRYIVFALGLCLGTSAWYILAQERSNDAPPVHPTVVPQINETGESAAPRQSEGVAAGSIKFGPVEPISGYAGAPVVILRESADAGAP